MTRPPRPPLVPPGTWLYRLAFLVFSLVVRVVYGLRVHGVEHVPLSGSCVIASNHDSGWDPLVVALATPRYLQFMAKRELFGKRLVARVLRAVGAFPVDRGRNDVGAIKEALRRLGAGGSVGVFFEGTRRPEAKSVMGGAAYLAQRTEAALVPTAIWREGRRFHVRFGAPLRARSRSREEVATLSTDLSQRVRAMLGDNSSTRPASNAG